ncbi:hypothetical protein KL938_002237 [Ogataea parapolymorpha]|nr:hypothetical protein KL938_002237 [Ogataea parapolymorpha]
MVSAYVRYLSPTWGVVAALLGGFLFLETFATPFHRQFYVPDPRISYPYTADSIPDARLAVYACVVPCVLIVLATATQYLRSSRDQKQRIVHLANVSCLALALALGLNGFVTEFIKVKVGRPRPDFLDRCGLSPKSPVPGLYTVTDCTAPYGEKALQDGFKSFPSGHSSFAWCGMNFLNLWISGHYRLYTGRSGFSVGKLVPLGPALLRPPARARAGTRATGVAVGLRKQQNRFLRYTSGEKSGKQTSTHVGRKHAKAGEQERHTHQPEGVGRHVRGVLQDQAVDAAEETDGRLLQETGQGL